MSCMSRKDGVGREGGATQDTSKLPSHIILLSLEPSGILCTSYLPQPFPNTSHFCFFGQRKYGEQTPTVYLHQFLTYLMLYHLYLHQNSELEGLVVGIMSFF